MSSSVPQCDSRVVRRWIWRHSLVRDPRSFNGIRITSYKAANTIFSCLQAIMPKQIVTPYMASQPTARAVLGRRVDTTMVALLQFRPAVAYSTASINVQGVRHKSNRRPVWKCRIVIRLLTPDIRPTLHNTNNCCRGQSGARAHAGEC